MRGEDVFLYAICGNCTCVRRKRILLNACIVQIPSCFNRFTLKYNKKFHGNGEINLSPIRIGRINLYTMGKLSLH